MMMMVMKKNIDAKDLMLSQGLYICLCNARQTPGAMQRILYMFSPL